MGCNKSSDIAGGVGRRANRRRGSFASWTIGIIALVLVAIPATSLARAGGGEGYSGGGGGYGGGGGHGGGGGGYLVYLLIQLLFHYPIIGIPLLIVVVYVIYAQRQRGGGDDQSGFMQRGDEVIDPQLESNILATLRQHDPQFSEPAFCQRVATAFYKIQQAWTEQDLKLVRPFISDGVHERFSLQFAEQRDAGVRDVLQGLAIDDVRIADVSAAGVFDEIAVRIAAHAADFRVGIADGQPRGGSMAVEPFVEVWSFLRKRGALTDMSKSGLMEGNCPNCGAPIEINESANCLRCKALLRSGEYDWVLSEITQESEWERSTQRPVPGLAALRRQDPGFDSLAMEDRASVMFWRKAAANRLGKIDPLRKMASEPFCKWYAARLSPAGDGTRSFIGECAVGSVQMVGFIPGDSSSEFERALIEIRWSGRRAGVPVVARTLFVLGRKAGSQTDAGKSISSAHCPNCGAPQSSDMSNACDYCHTTLNDGAHGWVLVELAAFSSPRGEELLSSLSAADNDRMGSPDVHQMYNPT
jgi:hypothetical protein